MTLSFESPFGVWLGGRRIGVFQRFGDRTRFTLLADYRDDPDRPVLGLVFEEQLTAVHSSAVRLAPWFSNLLPEGRLRDWIADEGRVNRAREIELMAQVGHDLPGAVTVLPEGESPVDPAWDGDTILYEDSEYVRPEIRFSLAGIAMKFSMVRSGERLTLPAHGQSGDWIVKLPDTRFDDVPRNEYAMMALARSVGINTPETMLVSRESIDTRVPERLWPAKEQFAYAVRRFDRDSSRRKIHMEDLAQVRNVYPERKYRGNFETIANLIYRRRDRASLVEFTRRLAFSILISNGDAHLKNWSLLYIDPRIPALSPAYDLVSTGSYDIGDHPEDLGLKFGGTKHFHLVSLGTFRRLQQRLEVTGLDLSESVAEVVELTLKNWPDHACLLSGNQTLQDRIHKSIVARSRTLLRRVG